MPNSKQRHAAERRRLERQAERRRQRATRRRRTNVIVSVAGTVVLVAVVVAVIAATMGSGGAKKATDAVTTTRPASSTAAPSTSAPSSSAVRTSAAASTKASATSTPTATKPPTTKSSATKSSASAAAAGGASTAATVRCYYPSSGTAARDVSKPPARAPAAGTVAVRLATSQGPLTFTLDRAPAPCTVNSFVSLARQGYYTGTSCHRLVTKKIFVVQCGDPTGTGGGGPGYKFNDELTGKEHYTRGVLAMANGGANTNGSQFYIVYRASPLGPAYPIFGRVSSGLGVVDKVVKAGTTGGSTDGRPKLPLTFTKVTVG